MTPRELIHLAAGRLRASGVPDPIYDAACLLAHVTGGHALSLRLDTDTQLASDVLQRYDHLIERRCGREPLQYLTAEQPFLGRIFHVDRRVLIPRPETELLGELAIGELRARPGSPRALDLCCGSGCLCISMALDVPHARVDGCDASPEALTVSRENARLLGAEVDFYQGDLFSAVPGGQWDVIVSNPPYIPSRVCAELQPEVRREPLLALDGGADGLDFYRRIAAEAPQRLFAGGALLLEVGDGQAGDVCALLSAAGLSELRVHRDLAGIERMIEARAERGDAPNVGTVSVDMGEI